MPFGRPSLRHSLAAAVVHRTRRVPPVTDPAAKRAELVALNRTRETEPPRWVQRHWQVETRDIGFPAYVLTPRSGTWTRTVVHLHGGSFTAVAHPAPDGEGIAGHALLEGQAINADDMQNDPRASRFAREFGLRSLLVVPIQYHGRGLGTISLHGVIPYAFSDGDSRLLTILASQAGLAIENAYLYDSQRRARMAAQRPELPQDDEREGDQQ